MKLRYWGMCDIGHGLVRVLVYVDGVGRYITCFAHEFPNEEKGLEWLRKQLEECNARLQ